LAGAVVRIVAFGWTPRQHATVSRAVILSLISRTARRRDAADREGVAALM